MGVSRLDNRRKYGGECHDHLWCGVFVGIIVAIKGLYSNSGNTFWPMPSDYHSMQIFKTIESFDLFLSFCCVQNTEAAM